MKRHIQSKNILIPVLLCLAGCGGQTSETSSSNDSSDPSCLADLIEGNQVEKMISAKQLAEIIGKSEADIEVKDNKSRSAKYSTIMYNWEPDEERMMVLKIKSPKAGGGEHVIETTTAVSNKVIVGNIDLLDSPSQEEDPKKYFRYTYGPKTAQEKESAKKSIDRSAAESDQASEKSAEALKSMVDKQSANQLDGVGDLAYWSAKEYSNVEDAILHVLHGNTIFKVTTDVSVDIQEDVEMAKKVAQKIIANCN